MSEIEKIKTLLEAGEIGDAQLFAELTQGNVLYDHRNNAWYFFNGIRWEQDKIEAVRRVLSDTLKDYYHTHIKQLDHEQNESTSKRAYARYRSLGRENSIKRVLSLAKTPCAFTGNWDNIPHKLACRNGVINLQTGELETGNPTDYLSYQIPTEYDAGADCPRFKQFLQEVFDNDREIIDFAQVLFGYGTLGTSRERIFAIFSGEGANGKDTLLKAVKSVLGVGICNAVSSEMFINIKYSNSTVAAYQLEGLHIAYTSESGAGASLDDERVKLITGDNAIPVKKLYQNVYDINPKHLLLLLTNHKPKADFIDQALWDRLILLEFKNRFVHNPTTDNEYEVDVKLDDKLAEEAPGILNWLIQGAVKYHKDGITIPDTLKMSATEYREQNNIVGEFIDSYCTRDATACTRGLELFKAFSEMTHEGKLTQKEFYKAVEKQGYERKHSRDGVLFYGLQLGKLVELERFIETE